jgi:1-acyl-sn-glycerol-3-phosphate acyltransferase
MLYDLGKFLCWLVIKAFLVMEVSGKEHLPSRGGFIVASNHISNLDPVAVGVACPRPLLFLAKQELFRNRFFGMILRSVNAYPLKRAGMDISAVKQALRWVRAGKALMIFPEGTRSHDGKLQKAQEGIGFLALKLGVPVVPAYVTGTDRALPRGSKFLRRTRISVRFGEQISVERGQAYSDVADAVMHAVGRLSCT